MASAGRGKNFHRAGNAARTGEVSISSSRRATAGVRLSIDLDVGPLFEHNAVWASRGGLAHDARGRRRRQARLARQPLHSDPGGAACGTRQPRKGRSIGARPLGVPGRQRAGARTAQRLRGGVSALRPDRARQHRGLGLRKGQVPERPRSHPAASPCGAVPTLLRPAPAGDRHSAAIPSKRRLQRRDTAATSWARLAASFPYIFRTEARSQS